MDQRLRVCMCVVCYLDVGSVQVAQRWENRAEARCAVWQPKPLKNWGGNPKLFTQTLQDENGSQKQHDIQDTCRIMELNGSVSNSNSLFGGVSACDIQKNKKQLYNPQIRTSWDDIKNTRIFYFIADRYDYYQPDRKHFNLVIWIHFRFSRSSKNSFDSKAFITS